MDISAKELKSKMTKGPFASVRAAREILKERASELVEKYCKIIDLAIESGELETAGKLTQWLIEHAPEEDGVRIIDSSAAKPKETGQPNQPAIKIGIALGGMPATQKALPSNVIDIDSEPHE